MGAAERETGPASKMQRLRARARLTEALHRTGTAFGGIPVGLRRLAGWVQSFGTEAQSAVTATVGVAAAVTIGLASFGPTATAGPTTGGPARVRVAREMPRTATAAHDSKRSKPQRVARGPVRTSASSSTQATQVAQAPHSQPKDQRSTEAAGTRAKTGSYKGVKYATVCTGEGTSTEADDQDISVAYNDGSQDGSSPGDEDC